MHDQHKQNDLKQSVLDRIDREGVTQVSRWFFVSRNIFFWGLWVVSALIGAAAIAAVVFAEEHAGWEFYEATHQDIWTFLVQILPYFWIVLLAIVLIIGQYNIRHTKKGYRYAPRILVVMSIGVSVVGGIVLYVAGTAKFIEHTIGEFIPFNHSVITVQRQLWNAPDAGRLIGIVGSGEPEATTTFITSDGHEWQVVTEALDENDLDLLFSNEEVRLLGYTATSSASSTPTFYICVVLPGTLPDGGSMPAKDAFSRRKEFVERMKDVDVDEINPIAMRINECESIRPHQQLPTKQPVH